jgi:hypothetical protein
MFAKEMRDARWKLLIGALVAIAAVALVASTYNLVRTVLVELQVTQTIPPALRGQLALPMSSYGAYAWSQWFPRTARRSSSFSPLFSAAA